ncbi:LAMI_0E12464g1_1 [Lachancea mirantina]|uniref:LAMI_0E12464g1_1 n=1 Tax=Lachancea mirantina TaxID=1230905 RepID=A0A1G4JQ54_9SACH|nr:LAMI_0E12464g1_1 [Lachancea mirantina]
MPIEKDLKTAYGVLYDDKEPEKALGIYDSVLKQSPTNLTALVYKAACLEKLYFGAVDWHNEQTLENAFELLQSGQDVAMKRGDRSKLAWVKFRIFTHFYNRKNYPEAERYFNESKHLGYDDPTLPLWQANLTKKLAKLQKRKKNLAQKEEPHIDALNANEEKLVLTAPVASVPAEEPSGSPTFKVDWYQSPTHVTIVLFTANMPHSKDDVTAKVSEEGRHLDVSFQTASTGSEFQYSTDLFHPVNPAAVTTSVFSKKIEISLQKETKQQWKQLERSEETPNVITNTVRTESVTQNVSGLRYPTSSKKTIDWSKFEIDDDTQEQENSADAFFQQLYANADPDTRRAMMKSYVESNGTALNTNWTEVSEKTVETRPPEGLELKKL